MELVIVYAQSPGSCAGHGKTVLGNDDWRSIPSAELGRIAFGFAPEIGRTGKIRTGLVETLRCPRGGRVLRRRGGVQSLPVQSEAAGWFETRRAEEEIIERWNVVAQRSEHRSGREWQAREGHGPERKKERRTRINGSIAWKRRLFEQVLVRSGRLFDGRRRLAGVPRRHDGARLAVCPRARRPRTAGPRFFLPSFMEIRVLRGSGRTVVRRLLRSVEQSVRSGMKRLVVRNAGTGRGRDPGRLREWSEEWICTVQAAHSFGMKAKRQTTCHQFKAFILSHHSTSHPSLIFMVRITTLITWIKFRHILCKFLCLFRCHLPPISAICRNRLLFKLLFHPKNVFHRYKEKFDTRRQDVLSRSCHPRKRKEWKHGIRSEHWKGIRESHGRITWQMMMNSKFIAWNSLRN